eukprot:363433-Chlamydomonas_euryale.AAC.19
MPLPAGQGSLSAAFCLQTRQAVEDPAACVQRACAWAALRVARPMQRRKRVLETLSYTPGKQGAPTLPPPEYLGSHATPEASCSARSATFGL